MAESNRRQVIVARSRPAGRARSTPSRSTLKTASPSADLTQISHKIADTPAPRAGDRGGRGRRLRGHHEDARVPAAVLTLEQVSASCRQRERMASSVRGSVDSVVIRHTAELDDATLAAARSLCDATFGDDFADANRGMRSVACTRPLRGRAAGRTRCAGRTAVPAPWTIAAHGLRRGGRCGD